MTKTGAILTEVLSSRCVGLWVANVSIDRDPSYVCEGAALTEVLAVGPWDAA
jgi:hypothetical protein